MYADKRGLKQINVPTSEKKAVTLEWNLPVAYIDFAKGRSGPHNIAQVENALIIIVNQHLRHNLCMVILTNQNICGWDI